VLKIDRKPDDRPALVKRSTDMLRRRIAISAAVVALVLSLILIGFRIWMGQAIVSIMSAHLIPLVLRGRTTKTSA
jgi:hypothetical protein